MTIETINCPKCGHELPDQDGFGFIGQCEVADFAITRVQA